MFRQGRINRAEAGAIGVTDTDAEKRMPWFQIALGLAVAVAAAIGWVAIRSWRQNRMRMRRSQKQRLEEDRIAREWEDLQQRLQGSNPT